MNPSPTGETNKSDQTRVRFLNTGLPDTPTRANHLSNELPRESITPIIPQDTAIEAPAASEYSVVYTLNLLIFNSFLGTLIRVGLNTLFSYGDQQVFPLIYAQMVGSFIFGFLYNTQKSLLNNNTNLFLGFGTGLCGCITTFSSFILQSFIYCFHIKDTVGVLQGILNAISIIVITLTASLASLKYGMLLGNHFNQYHLSRMPAQTNQTNNPFTLMKDSLIKSSLLFLLSVVPWVLIIVTSILVPQGRSWTIALAISPLGTLLRMLLRRLNNLSPGFYWGTFTANILGTGILGMIYIFEQPKLGYCTSEKPWVCDLLFGISNGFCACLTTISTFVFELHQLNSKRAHQYGIISIVSGHLILLVIVGSWYWTNGTNQ